MFNAEKLLESRINRLKHFAGTDKLDSASKRIFVMQNAMLILQTFYGSLWMTVFHINKYFVREVYKNIEVKVRLAYYRKVLRLNHRQIDERFAEIKLEE